MGVLSCIDISASISTFFVLRTLVHWCLWPFHALPICTAAKGTMQPLHPLSSDRKTSSLFWKVPWVQSPTETPLPIICFGSLLEGSHEVREDIPQLELLLHTRVLLARLWDTLGSFWSLPPTRSPLGITSRAVWLALDGSRRAQPLLPLQTWVVQPPWEWGGRAGVGGATHTPLPLPKHLVSPINREQERLSLLRRRDGAQEAEAGRQASPGGLRSLPIPPCPTLTPHGLRLLRLAATNTRSDSMESVAETGTG